MPRNLTGIKRLASGKFQARVCIPKTRRTQKKRFTTAQEAYNWRMATLADLRKGGGRRREKVPMLSEALLKFEEWAEGKRPATARWTRWICNRLRRTPYLEKPLDEITHQDAERFRRELLEEELAAETVDHYLKWLKRLLTLYVEWKILPQSPLDGVKLIREKSERVRYLSPEEEVALLAACGQRLRQVVLFAMLTGARKGEIQGLTWDKVNLERGLAQVPAGQAKAKRDRWLYLNPEVVALLKELKEAHNNKEEERKKIDPSEQVDRPNTVFPGLRGGLWWRLDKGFQAARRRAAAACPSLADFHFHDLRHTFASRLVQSGIDLYRVKELLGHSDIKQTQRYAHLSPGGLADAVKAVKTTYAVPFDAHNSSNSPI